MRSKKTFLIGEIGINHNGKLSTALELIEKAKECKVDAVKFQKRFKLPAQGGFQHFLYFVQ